MTPQTNPFKWATTDGESHGSPSSRSRNRKNGLGNASDKRHCKRLLTDTDVLRRAGCYVAWEVPRQQIP
ncbi:hypothetical protein Acr_25g0006130 [Actinidia rufa]|uniref:Uncharacterized protein n=1 Tax=Actinidia rufa TaxID=165716 RepID=A0A7J0H096_9ERIC|nr:hypothetical protein Acr_25g0006130 [Actinidia rufa]